MPNCINCGATLDLKNTSSKTIKCEYCDSEFYIGEIIPDSISANDLDKDNIPDFFNIINKDFNEDGISSFKTLCSLLCDSEKTADIIFESLLSKANNSKEISFKGHNDTNLIKLAQNYSDIIKSSDDIIFFQDYGLISKLKQGLILTNDSLIFIDKKKTFIVKYTDITSLQKSNIAKWWNINSDSNSSISGMGLNNDGLGHLLAFIIKKSIILNPNAKFDITSEK